MKHTILCVDDEADNVDALERIFRHKYNVLKAQSGQEALTLLDQHPEPIAVIITDQRMPIMTGVEFLEQSIRRQPDTVRILLTGYTDIQSIISAVNSGQIYRYINKPWDPVDLQATVERAVERFVLHRELKLKNDELTRAYADLKSLDQAKDRFMILINHELKTPLTSIMSFSQLLKETKLDEEQEVCVNRIVRSSDKLKNIIDDVLLVLGAETKTLKVKVQPFDCQSLNFSLPAEVATLMSQKGQKVISQGITKKIVADQTLVEQVLRRLIHNAAKFGQENSHIELKAQLTQPHRVRFSVYNLGPSISENVISKIFSPFFLDEDVMNHSTGMGLGLTICQSILKSHSSSLHIENRSGGVEAWFELPCL
ncbi:MAG: hypothetical protein BroJett040_14520 [Oligoflexia bacterium]|nr:MAG: hypothetical protein BroJett040_14520 [Oligoflexia bacterium]